jgi:uncharacterized protein (TIRG00374 family)
MSNNNSMKRINIRKAALIGATISLAVYLSISIIFGVKPKEILSLGTEAIVISIILVLCRLIIQGVRFHIIAKQLDNSKQLDISSNIMVRIGSEFISLITPSYLGGEAIRIAFLRKKGIKTGEAIWSSYLEIFYDVIFASLASLAAISYAIYLGANQIAILVLVTTIPSLAFFLTVTILSRKGKVKLPEIVIRILKRIAGKRITNAVEIRIKEATESYGKAAGSFLGSSSIKNFTALCILSAMKVILAGAIFLVVLQEFGVESNLFISTILVYSSIAISSLPITPGGSGLSEFGMSLFLSSIYNQKLWSAIIIWRMLSYYLPVIISALCLIIATNKEWVNKN